MIWDVDEQAFSISMLMSKLVEMNNKGEKEVDMLNVSYDTLVLMQASLDIYASMGMMPKLLTKLDARLDRLENLMIGVSPGNAYSNKPLKQLFGGSRAGKTTMGAQVAQDVSDGLDRMRRDDAKTISKER